MSEVLHKFIAPYRASANNLTEYRNLVSMAAIAWNISLLEEDQQQETIEKIFKKEFFKDDAHSKQESQELLDELITRKQQLES